MNLLPHIDDYFMGQLPDEMKNEFESKILQDPVFAEEVAFYLSAKNILLADAIKERKERFAGIYQQYKGTQKTAKSSGIIRKLWPYVAAAAILGALLIGLNTWLKPVPVKQMADQYVKEHFQTLSVTMGGKEDSLQTGRRLYNEGKLNDALAQFESIMNRDTSSGEAKKLAGIVALHLGQYNKALKYFEELENYPGLRVNPGKFYQAITLMERGQSGDKELAKQLLIKVEEENLEGKKQAREWLKKF